MKRKGERRRNDQLCLSLFLLSICLVIPACGDGGGGGSSVSQPSLTMLVDMNDGTIYDIDTQLSWLKNADTAGLMTWDQAVTWAASLNNSGGYAGLTGWRLPTTAEPDATCGYQYNPGGGFPLQGYGYNCTGSEMGHLHYVSLGRAAGPNDFSNTGPFTNVQAFSYWSGSEYAPNATSAWYFDFFYGTQGYIDKGANRYAWAVRPGARSR